MTVRQIMFLGVFLGSLFFITACDEARKPAEQLPVEVVPGTEQVAMFVQTSPAQLKKDVNNWLSKNHGKVEIIRVLQSQSGSTVITISIFYKKME